MGLSIKAFLIVTPCAQRVHHSGIHLPYVRVKRCAERAEVSAFPLWWGCDIRPENVQRIDLKHAIPKRRDPFDMLASAVDAGWETVASIPLKGEGMFWVLTLSGLVRLARNRKPFRQARPKDGYGPMRTTVSSVETGNYLAAIAWKRIDENGTAMPPAITPSR